jgi:signal peptidase
MNRQNLFLHIHTMHRFWKTINILLLVGILSVGVLLVGTMVPIPGNFKVKIVKSGSMEPTIMTGGIVVIKPETNYQVGDIVTFGADTKTQIPTTHRIIEMGDSAFGRSVRTQGDANNAPDPRLTPVSDIHGKVVLTIPYVGFLLDFARKPIGFALLVGLPAFAVIVDEIGKIVAEVKRLRKKKHDSGISGDGGEKDRIAKDTEPKDAGVVKMKRNTPIGLAPWSPREMAYAAPHPLPVKVASSVRRGNLPLQMLFVLLLPLSTLGALSAVGSTVSYYSDVESVIGNFLKADPLGFDVTLLGSAQVDMGAGSAFLSPILTPTEDSEPIQYALSAIMTEGDTTLCGLLVVESTSTFMYSGPLLLLSTGMTTTTGALPLRFYLPDGYASNENSSCFVDLIFTGRNANADLGQGYNLTVHLPIQFFVPGITLTPPPATFAEPAVSEAIITEVESTSTDAFVENNSTSSPSVIEEGSTPPQVETTAPATDALPVSSQDDASQQPADLEEATPSV